MLTCCPRATLQRLFGILCLPNLAFQIPMTSPLPQMPLAGCAWSREEDLGRKRETMLGCFSPYGGPCGKNETDVCLSPLSCQYRPWLSWLLMLLPAFVRPSRSPEFGGSPAIVGVASPLPCCWLLVCCPMLYGASSLSFVLCFCRRCVLWCRACCCAWCCTVLGCGVMLALCGVVVLSCAVVSLVGLWCPVLRRCGGRVLVAMLCLFLLVAALCCSVLVALWWCCVGGVVALRWLRCSWCSSFAVFSPLWCLQVAF
jgi:hypothetical protein